jgi:hypothetical protein
VSQENVELVRALIPTFETVTALLREEGAFERTKAVLEPSSTPTWNLA